MVLFYFSVQVAVIWFSLYGSCIGGLKYEMPGKLQGGLINQCPTLLSTFVS